MFLGLSAFGPAQLVVLTSVGQLPGHPRAHSHHPSFEMFMRRLEGTSYLRVWQGYFRGSQTVVSSVSTLSVTPGLSCGRGVKEAGFHSPHANVASSLEGLVVVPR